MSAAFVVNGSTLSAIRKLKDGEGRYILDVVAGGPSTILGYPVLEQPAAASIATGTKASLLRRLQLGEGCNHWS